MDEKYSYTNNLRIVLPSVILQWLKQGYPETKLKLVITEVTVYCILKIFISPGIPEVEDAEINPGSIGYGDFGVESPCAVIKPGSIFISDAIELRTGKNREKFAHIDFGQNRYGELIYRFFAGSYASHLILHKVVEPYRCPSV